MPWYIYALLASLIFAIIPLEKRKFNHNPRDVMFWSSIFAFFLTLVMFPILEFPDLNLFYLGAIFTGLSGVFGGILQFKLSEQHAGRTLPLQLPVQILACFVFYCLLHPSYYHSLLSNIYGSFALGGSLLVLILASQFLRRSDISLVGLIVIAPVSLLFGVIIVYYKMVMGILPGHVSNIILVYIMVHYFTISTCFLIENIVNSRRIINISEKITANSLLVAVMYVFGYYFLFMAVYYAANPALAIAFNLLIPVWIKIYSLILNKEDDANLKIVLIMLMAVSIMVAVG